MDININCELSENMRKKNEKRKEITYYLPLIVTIIFTVVLLFLPTGYEDAIIEKGTDRVVATVVNESSDFIIDTGLIRTGEQLCTVKIEYGKFKGEVVEAVNMLQGSLETDKLFSKGDKALIVVNYSNDTIKSVTMVDHFRVHKEIVLGIIFIAFLVFFAGETGVRAILSFAITILCIWKILVPMYLNGFNPIIIGMVITLLLTTIIISLVYGFNKLALAAILGATLGVVATCIMAIISTKYFNIHGAVMSGSESLLYSGFEYLNLTQIFMASIFIGSSGAMMDLAVDITSSMKEIVDKKPNIGKKEALESGLNIGRAAMGTMTTTLLLAYSGGFIALLMVFMAQGTPILNILNYKYIAAELTHTVVGSFGLVLVAPFTAFTCSILITKNHKEIFEN
ncbi:MAG: YibE/F family protein [Lachnospirales bacterium]